MSDYKMVPVEPVAYISHTSEGDILGWERQFDAPSHTPLYATLQPAEQQPDVTQLVEALEFIAKSVHPQGNGPGVVIRDVDGRDWRNWLETAEQLLAAPRKGGEA